MPERGVSPELITYNTVISACAKCGEGDQVRLPLLVDCAFHHVSCQQPQSRLFNSHARVS